MRRVIVRYRVRPDRVDENESLVRAVYAELAESQPTGLRYATFRLADGVSFVHIALLEDPTDNPLQKVAAFRAFSEDVGGRCDEPPVVVEMDEVGSYRF